MEEKIREKIQEIGQEREKNRLGGGAKEIERQHGKGKLTARERVELLFDSGTFRELELWAQPMRTGFDDVDARSLPADAVVIGFGKVHGRWVYAYAHDFTEMSGTQSAVQHSKVTKAIDTATKMMIPYVGIVDSAGIRIQDMMGEPTFRAPISGYGIGETGSFMYSPPWASGVIPQIALMLGPQFAGSSYSPILKDFLIMRRSSEVYMALCSPPAIKDVTGEVVTYADIGSSEVHAEISGTCDLVVDSDEEGIGKTRELLSFLPSNYRERPPIIDTGDPSTRRDEELLNLAEKRDMYEIIYRLIDNRHFFPIKPIYAKNIIVGFARLNGQTVGMVANNPQVMQGAIDRDSSDKMARFIRFCDAFNIPLIFLVDSVGFLPSKEQEELGLERHAAKVPYAICEATVPKITVYIGECSGYAELAMGTGPMGVDLTVAWPTAKVGFLDPELAVNTIYEKELKTAENCEEVRKKRIEEFVQKYNNLYHAGARQLIQDIIDPRDTREQLSNALACFANKEEVRPWKKHGNIPL